MMFRLIMKCLAFLHSQLIAVQQARINQIESHQDDIKELELKARIAQEEHDSAKKIKDVLVGILPTK